MKVKGRLIGGSFGEIVIREKSGERLELGDLLVAEGETGYTILQVYDLAYGSQIRQQSVELLAGMRLEGYGASLDFMEPELRNYVLAGIKAVATITHDGEPQIPKTLPRFFSDVRQVEENDLQFMLRPERGVYIGKVRSGSKTLDVDVYMDADQVFRHHILIPAITGRGKSNLVKVMAWSVLDSDDYGLLILDPHDEYYGRHELGLKDHTTAHERLVYYSPDPPTGQKTLTINLTSLKPYHFQGIVGFTPAQQQAIRIYHTRFKDNWIEDIVKGTEIPDSGIQEVTLGVLQRKLEYSLGVYQDESGNVRSRSEVFSTTAGETTLDQMTRELKDGKTVIVDTSRLMGDAELLIGSVIVGSIFYQYQRLKAEGTLEHKPTVSVVLEEAPRVLSGDVIEKKGENIYATIAREGRKFKVGLVAITQLTSLIPKTVLTNMNTKIILANEMKTERMAIIESAAQDLSRDERTIASLDVGEALLSSNFTKFAVPVKIPLFQEYAQTQLQQADKKEEKDLSYEGVDLT